MLVSHANLPGSMLNSRANPFLFLLKKTPVDHVCQKKKISSSVKLSSVWFKRTFSSAPRRQTPTSFPEYP